MLLYDEASLDIGRVRDVFGDGELDSRRRRRRRTTQLSIASDAACSLLVV